MQSNSCTEENLYALEVLIYMNREEILMLTLLQFDSTNFINVISKSRKIRNKYELMFNLEVLWLFSAIFLQFERQMLL